MPSNPAAREQTSTSTAPFWNALDNTTQTALSNAARVRRFRPGQALMWQGDRSEHVAIIQAGWTKVTAATQDGHEVVLAIRGPGDLVGESAVLGPRIRSATVTALDSLTALVIPAARFTTVLDENPYLWRIVSATLAMRIEESNTRLQAQTLATAAERLAHLLLNLARLSATDSNQRDKAVVIAPPLSQEELARWVDSSRETVARALQTWRRQGIIATRRRSIEILDRNALRDHADVRAAQRPG